MPDQTVHCVVERAAKLSEPTRKTSLHEPLAYDNAYAHSMRYRAYNDDGTEADLTGYSVVGAFTPSGHNTIKPLLNGTISGNVAELILPSACYKHPGRFKFTMNLTKGSVSRSVLWVEGMVERNQTDTIEAPTEVLDVSQVITDAQTATANANAAVDRANGIANSLVNDSVNAITAAGTQQRQSVNDLGGQLKDYLEDHYGETTNKVAAKANRSSVSNVKHAIGADGQLNLTDALNEPAKKIMIHLEPKQDLHGYDKPWVGGSGKNLCPTLSTVKTAAGITSTVNDDGSITCTGTAMASTWAAISYQPVRLVGGQNYILNGCATGGGASSYRLDVRTNADTLDPECSNVDTGNVPNGVSVNPSTTHDVYIAVRVATGYSFPSGGVTFKPMLRLATETDSTYEPYSNICPIEGFDSVEVVSTGKNLFDKNNLDPTPGYLTEPSALISNSANYRVSNWIRVNAGEKYTVSNGTTRGESPSYAWYDENRNLLQVTYHHSGGFPQTYTAPDGAYWLRESVHVSDLDTFMLEKGTTASSYEPFGNSVSLNLVSSAGSTVYGGTVTVNEDGSGTLVVDRAIVDLGSLTWDRGTYSGVVQYSSSGISKIVKRPPNNLTVAEIACSCYDAVARDDIYNGLVQYGVSVNGNAGVIWIGDPRYSTAEDFKAGVTGQLLIYVLATPYTYSLTATQLQTLIGTNHIWTDGTSIDLDYYSDKYGLVDRLFAAFPKDTATGNPAAFTDGADDLPVEKLEIAIEPKQDLHGYDHPWVGGAGKNLLGGFDDYGVYGIAIKDTVNGISISGTFASGQTQFSYTLLNKILPTGTYIVNGINGAGGSSYQLVITGGGMSGTKYGATNNTTFTSDGATAIIVRLFVYSGGSPYNVVVPWQIESGTTPTTYEPYENICPISGWDDIAINRYGKNLYSAKIGRDVFANNVGATHTSDADEMTVVVSDATSSGIYSGITSVIRQLINTLNGDYTISMDIKSNAARNDILFGVQGIRVTVISVTTSWTRVSIAATFDGTNKPLILYNNHGGTGTGCTLTIRNLMVEAGLTATDYEPYAENAITVPIQSISGSTVYGGKLVVNRDGTGKLVVDKELYVQNGSGNISILTAFESGNVFWDQTRNFPLDNYSDKYIMNLFSTNTARNSNDSPFGSYMYAQTIRYKVPKNIAETIAEFKAYLAEHPLQMLFPISTPVTYPLTAPQITTLLGTNHISCDAGEVTVTYHADPTLFITKKIAQALNA